VKGVKVEVKKRMSGGALCDNYKVAKSKPEASEDLFWERMRERARRGSYTEEAYASERIFFSKGPSHASYRVQVAARNGRPKVIEFNGGWQLGATPSGLILTRADSIISYEIPKVEGVTAAEWDKKGLSDAQIEAAGAYLIELKISLAARAEPAC
jgi:hypothetical protein